MLKSNLFMMTILDPYGAYSFLLFPCCSFSQNNPLGLEQEELNLFGHQNGHINNLNAGLSGNLIKLLHSCYLFFL